jgi:hypothetical protein
LGVCLGQHENATTHFRIAEVQKMPANSRDNFDPWQKKVTLEANSKGVKARWEEFKDSAETYYMCEHCRFVSASRDYF